MVATARGQSLMTAEEFYAWAELPENSDKQYELENGVPVEMPPPHPWHGTVCWLAIHVLTTYVLPRGGRLVTNDAALIVRRRPDTVRGPDIMLFLDRPNVDDIPRTPETAIPPLVVEMLSPSDKTHRVTRRIKSYLKRGISTVWTLDPEDRTVSIHKPNQEAVVLEATEELAGDPELPGFRCPVATFFSWPEAPTTPAAT